MRRRNSLEIEDVVYTGEVIDTPKKSENKDLQKETSEHAISMKKLDVANEVVQIGKQIVNIFEIRSNSAAKIDEINAQIHQLEVMTEREVKVRQQSTSHLQAKGKIVTDILRELTPILISSNLKTEERTAAMQLFNGVIDKVLENNE